MRDRILGPHRGYYVSAACLLGGELGDRYSGWGKVLAHRPSRTLDSGEVRSVHSCSWHSTVEAALDDAEDMAFDALEQLPEREAPRAGDGPLEAIIYAPLSWAGTAWAKSSPAASY